MIRTAGKRASGKTIAATEMIRTAGKRASGKTIAAAAKKSKNGEAAAAEKRTGVRKAGAEKMSGAEKTSGAEKMSGAEKTARMRRIMKTAAAVAVALFIGWTGGYVTADGMGLKTDSRLVAFRIGNQRDVIDYDMLAAIRFLEYKFRQEGYKIAGYAYAGDMYPKELDAAGVNVFVRGFPNFYDLRMNPNSRNIYYMHRFAQFYAEELRNFDYYLSSQKKVLDAVDGRVRVDLLPGGFVPHERLIPGTYAYDVLYIYEFYNPVYDAFIRRYNNPKTYSGARFAALSDEEREEELKKAKLVVYEMGPVGEDDEIYVPYAAYDIISYGRPLLTNRKPNLDWYFGGDVWLFDDVESMALATNQALNTADGIRERKAADARLILESFMNMRVPFMQKLGADISRPGRSEKAAQRDSVPGGPLRRRG